MNENLIDPYSILFNNGFIQPQFVPDSYDIIMGYVFILGDDSIYNAAGDGTDHEKDNKRNKKYGRNYQ